jgi:hypothetical protein
MQAPFSTQGLNRYSYVFNDPVNHTDPSGFATDDSARLGEALFTYFGSVVAADMVQVLTHSSVATSAQVGLASGLATGVGFGALNVGIRALTTGLGGGRPGGVSTVTPTTAARAVGVGPGSMQAAGDTWGRVGPAQPQRGASSLQAKEPGGDWNPDGSKNILPGETCMAEDCTTLYYIPLIELPDNFWVVRALVRETAAQAWKQVVRLFNRTLPVPKRFARVVPGDVVAPTTLAPPTAADAFVADAAEIQGMNAQQLADALAIEPSSSGFQVIEFSSEGLSVASPVARSNPRFIGGGVTAGGVREFVIPNGPIPAGAVTRFVH